ncbi:hypothetical protein ILUMI_25891 [Ignelater luminosus]|uniref:Peptidase S1 domain-containing protein n=1 Tax=Ignelater luminosus TaxID=2038154 RepID=A0A8K0C4U8_IGNLU|nr:hypothetical protein ILUMI_25891 [Ignelater luminosus]
MLRLIVLTAIVAFAAAVPAGVPMLDGRIVGGRDTEVDNYPHQISLQYFGSHICGVVAVSRIIQHENFDGRTIDNDISLLQLAQDITHPKSKAVGLVDQELATGTPVDVTGWGALREGGSSPIQLQTVTVNTVTRQECRAAYGQSAISDQMICAGGGGGKDSCQGDSGGPMVRSGNQVLAGVVSWGYGCARPGYPGVYSNVAGLRDWIKRNSGI